MRRRLAVVLLACLTLASCSTAGDSSDAGASERASTTGPTTTTSSTTTTTDAGDDAPSDPLPGDVPDATFAGLGDPRIDVTHYDVTLRAAPDEDEVSGTASLTLRSTVDEPLSAFTLDLRGPKITELEIDGVAAEVSTASQEIAITPAEPIAPDTDVELTATYAGVPDQTEFPGWGMAVGWQGDDEGGWFTMSEPDGTSSWVPVNDHPSDKATWTISLVVPKGVTGIANGRLQDGKAKPAGKGRVRWTWVEAEPMAPYLVLVAIGDYDLVRSQHGKVEVLRAFPTSLSEEDRAAFDDIEEILDYFSSEFGAYPNDDAGAIVVPTDLGLALESQTRPLFGTDGIEDGYASALPHELAHQWFGDAITPATWRDIWLNEGFATYADWMWDEHTGGRSVDRQADRTARTQPVKDLPVRAPDAAAAFGPEVYDGGALTLQALRETVGDDAFFRIVRRWFAAYDGKTATTADFVSLASDESGQDLSGFFEAWLDQAPQPALPG